MASIALTRPERNRCRSKTPIATLKATRDQARVDADRALALLQIISQKSITPQMLRKFASTARDRMRLPGGGYRRDQLRALAQRVEVDQSEVRIMGSKGNLLRTLAGSADPRGHVPSFVPKWRRRWDSNPRWTFTHVGFQDRCIKPLCHSSVIVRIIGVARF
jgi:site-specific DNA recombinase